MTPGGLHLIAGTDVVSADGDGSVFAEAERVEEMLAAAGEIRPREREQARRCASGETLRRQTTSRRHVRPIRRALEG